MPIIDIDGIATRYELVGSGPPLLMFSPGGFNATLENWTALGIYRLVRPVDHLSRHYTCIIFDRRESGQSGGRVERVTWADYAAQGKGLLDHLGIGRAHVMGGCQGCSPAAAFGVAHPDIVLSIVMYWPAGGPRYRISGHSRFAQHVAYAQQEGLEQVLALAMSSGKHFGEDPRLGPWASVLRLDESFVEAYVRQDPGRYVALVAAMARTLLDRDTVPGAEPEELLQLDVPTLIVPGRDASHATSAARYLEECLPAATYWDVAVADQTEHAGDRMLEFLDAVRAKASGAGQ